MPRVPSPIQEVPVTISPPPHLPPIQLWEDLRSLLAELDWFVTRDWTQIVAKADVAKAIIKRATRAALMAEDIRTDLFHSLPPHPPSETNPAEPNPIRDFLESSFHDPTPVEDIPQVTAIPVSVDQVILYEFGQPKEHEHPLYVHHHVVNFCAAFYHEDQFIFARAHLQLLLTPSNHLNWLAGVRSVAVDQTNNPLPYVPDGTLFHTLGTGITQLIYLHQTELIMKIKQGKRFSHEYKLSGAVMPAGMTMMQTVGSPTTERQQPSWINPTT